MYEKVMNERDELPKNLIEKLDYMDL